MEDVKELRKLWAGFQQARVLLTANNLNLFEHLKVSKTVKQVSENLAIDKRAAEILLDALTGIGLLKKQKSKYKNTPLSRCLLLKESPYYQGDIIRHAHTLWQNWSGLDEVIKTGKPSRRAFNHEAFILGMHNLASLKVKDVLKAINLHGVKTVLDLGGGPGTYAIEMAKRGISVTLFDMPETVEIAKAVAEKYNVRAIKFIAGDFLNHDIGKGYDLIFISQIFHAYKEKDNLSLLRKSHKALNQKGRVVIQEFHINEERTQPPQSALFSVNMLVATEGGRCYSPHEMKTWLRKTGFKKIKEKLFMDNILIEGEVRDL